MTVWNNEIPFSDAWLAEAKSCPEAEKIGMYLLHNGVVRATAKAEVREGQRCDSVAGLEFSYDREKVLAALSETESLPGIYYIRLWLNSGRLSVGDDLMYVLVGGDIRPRVIDTLQHLVERLKSECVTERELTYSGT